MTIAEIFKTGGNKLRLMLATAEVRDSTINPFERSMKLRRSPAEKGESLIVPTKVTSNGKGSDTVDDKNHSSHKTSDGFEFEVGVRATRKDDKLRVA